jgi:hypothetical protein
MALTKVTIGTVTRSWGGETGEASYVAHRSPLTNDLSSPGPATVLLGYFDSAGEAQQAIRNSLKGNSISFVKEKLKGDIEQWLAQLSIVS